MNDLNNPAQTPVTMQDRISRSVNASETPVLVAVDFSPESEAATIWACTFAESVGAPLEILHVIHDPPESPGTYRPDNGDLLEPMADVAQRKLAGFIARVGDDNPALPGLKSATPLCTPGLPATTILQVAQARGARHLVMGRQRRKGLAGMFNGSIANKVVGNARLPVTIVKVDG